MNTNGISVFSRRERTISKIPSTVVPDASALLRPLAEQVAELERKAIAAALKAHGGNKLATARQLGISRATLYGRLENPE